MRRLILIRIPFALIVLASVGWYWLLHTHSGAHWVWTLATSATGKAMQAEQFSGDFTSGVTIRRLQFSTESVDLVVNDIFIAAEVRLFPIRIQLRETTVDGVDLQLRESSRNSGPGGITTTLESLALPLLIDIVDLTVRDITIRSTDQEREIEVDLLTGNVAWQKDITLRDLTVATRDASAELSGSLVLARPFAMHFDGSISVEPTLTQQTRTIDVVLGANGDLTQLSIEANSAPIESRLSGTVFDILDSPSWDLRLDIPEFSRSFAESEVKIVNAHAVSSGYPGEYSFQAATAIEAYGQSPFQFSIVASGHSSGISVSDFSLVNETIEVDGSGDIRWSDDRSVKAQLNLQKLDPHQWIKTWPAEKRVRAKLQVLLNEKIFSVTDSQLSVDGTPLSVDAKFEVDRLTTVVSGNLSWENLRWPVADGSAALSSETGTISVDGLLEDWRIRGQFSVGTETLPTGQFHIDGRGDQNHIRGTIGESAVFGGTVRGDADYNWRAKNGSAALDVTDIDIGSLFDQWPGVLSGHIDLEGQNEPFRVDLTLDKISGTLRDKTFAASGQIEFGEKRVIATSLSLEHGRATAKLDGSLYTSAGMAFDLNIDDLGTYIDRAGGTFDTSGVLSLHDKIPTLRINGVGEKINYGNISIADIAIIDHSDSSHGINVEVAAAKIVLAGKTVEDVGLLLKIDDDSQTLQLAGTFGPAQIQLLLDGALDDRPGPPNWNGRLQELDLTLADEKQLTLIEPTDLHVSATETSIGPTCLSSGPGMRACTAAKWNKNGAFGLSLDLNDVPLELANYFVDRRVTFEQRLNGNIDWQESPDSGTTGSASIALSPGTIASIERPELTIETERGQLSFSVANGKLLSGNAFLPMPGFGNINAEFSVADVANPRNSAVNGSLGIALSDIAMAATFSPLIDEAHGTFEANLDLAGTMQDPQVTGRVSLDDSSIVYQPIGLKLNDMNVSGLLQADGLLELNGEFMAGEGRGEIRTRSNRRETSKQFLEFELRGNNLTLIDVKDIQARADLDVRLSYDQDKLTLGGRIEIPHARIKPSNLNLAREAESDDVVIVAGELPEDSAEESTQRKLQVAGSLEIGFGDDILIDIGPATAKLTGSTLFTWGDELIPIADGRYDLTGSVQAFGQVLEITEGGVRFPKIPADNPFIRVRAVREIFGNPQVKTAGILVEGTVRRPIVTAYTDPLTTEERALAMLITGSDFDFEQGVGAIDFGTYIAPRIFVSYGVSLFERENVLRVRYDLSRAFGITATSGEQETGVDLNYRLER